MCALKSTLKMSHFVELSPVQRHRNLAGCICETKIALKEAYLTFPWQPKQIWKWKGYETTAILF